MAFERLQHAIISQSDDETIFAWTSREEQEKRGMLASSPAEFPNTGHIRPIHYERKRSPATISSRGLAIDYAFSHPLARAWDVIRKTLFGGPLSTSSEGIRLRLDCELVNEQEHDYWAGVYLRRDAMTSNWFRESPSRLLYVRQNGYVKKLYPAFVGWKTIYVKEPEQSSRNLKSMDKKTPNVSSVAYTKYSRSIGISLLWQAADLLSGASWRWFACAWHVLFDLPDANMTLTWAYLTINWQM